MTDLTPEPYTGTYTKVRGHDLAPLVMLLGAHTPLGQLTNMEARTVFEFAEQRGYIVYKADEASNA
jgi:hypothetical protein